MPLHLLGKKSWNVYNPESIARVRRDEAVAEAKEAEHERRQRDQESANRLELLRTGTTTIASHEEDQKTHSHTTDRDRSRKKRRLNGENDTDRDLRLARADVADRDQTSLFDSKGHISLIAGRPSERKETTTAESEQGMRFKDAAGRREHGRAPWYTNTQKQDDPESRQVGHDVWGNEDPRRQDREQRRMSSNDPLMAIKRGVKKLRDNEKQKSEWMAQRERDLDEVEDLARKHYKHKRRRRSSSNEGSLEDFSLDAVNQNKSTTQENSDRRHHRHKHRHRHGHDRHKSRHRRRS